MHAPLLGHRRAVIGEVEDAVRAAVQGDGPRTLVLTAGPGLGKTHTLARLVEALGLHAQVHWAAADDLSWHRPYGVAASLLDIPLPIEPSPADIVPACSPGALHAALDSLLEHGMHVMVVDDVHNADADSLRFLDELSAVARDCPLVLLLTRRYLPVRDLLTRLLARSWVREWRLPLMDATDLSTLTHGLLGGWPGPRLADALSQSGGNPLYALAVLDDLGNRGALAVGDGWARLQGSARGTAPRPLRTAVSGQLALLDDRSRSLVQTLAVWGEPAGLDELAAIDDVSPMSLVSTAQTAIDAGIVVADDDGTIDFTHDVYADVAYEGLEPSLRRYLHSAIGRDHESASAADTAAPTVRRPSGQAVHLDLDMATALARSGQWSRAAESAQRGLSHAPDLTTVAHLRQVLAFTLIARGQSTRALELIDSTLRLDVDPIVGAALADAARYARMLSGVEPLPSRPPFSDRAATVGELVTEALRRFLSGHGDAGLELAVEASLLDDRPHDEYDLTVPADIWPPFIEQYVHGPVAADDLLERTITDHPDVDASWTTAYHDFTRAGIALARGRLDDAEAAADAGLERANAGDLGWTSFGEGTRAMIDVYRGRFSPAATRLDRFAASGLPDQFGVPLPAHAQVLLLEMQRKLRPAEALAHECWTQTTGLALDGWLPSLAVDCARIAHRGHRTDLSRLVCAGLTDLPKPLSEAARGPVELALALCSGAPQTIADAAARTAAAAAEHDDRISEGQAWEEAACAAAALGDRSSARRHARRALQISQGMGAAALSNRITSRLRALGLRMDPRPLHGRPSTGWPSLTRAETTVAELVAEGYNSTEIAHDLYISPRTVQTHVSNALRKLGLRTRVELAAYVATRRTSPRDADPRSVRPS